MPLIETQIHVAAPPARVWSVITDFASFEQWNPMMVSVKVTSPEGKVEKGAKLRIRVILREGRPPRQVPATVFVCEPERELRWGGGVPGLLWVEHWLSFSPEGEGTRVQHNEQFTGLLAGMGLWLIGLTRTPYERMNEALKRRVEDPAGQSGIG